MTSTGRLITADAITELNSWKTSCVDLTVTSPPYDNLRNYNGYEFDAESMLSAILHVTKPGGVCVWVVGEKINGGRSLTSFDHAFVGRDAGWTVHDVMIHQKRNTPFMRSNAYTNCYELMVVFSNGKPKTFNPITEPTKRADGSTPVEPPIGLFWRCPICEKEGIVGVTVKLVLDHRHLTGDARDYICDSCNTGLGRFRNRRDFLKNAVAYLDKWEPND